MILCFLFGLSFAINILLLTLLFINRKTNKIISNLNKLEDFDLFDSFYNGDSIENRKEE